MDRILLVKDMMVKNFTAIPQDATIREAAEILQNGGFSGAPVVDGKNNLVGIISEKDLFQTLYPTYDEFYQEEALIPTMDSEAMQKWLKESGNKRIKDIIKKPISTTPETPLVKIGAIMLAQGIHRLPVLENGKLVGIITRRSLYRTIFRHLFGFD